MGWIGVDLDGTLARYDGWKNGEIGAPIPKMVERVKRWLAEGKDVRIFTARVGLLPDAYSSESKRNADPVFAAEQMNLIRAWCLQHIGRELPITAQKDFMLEEIWDDRAVQVKINTGEALGQNA